jgi:hypothetical protein
MPAKREIEENRKYYDGSHFDSWIGPIVPPAADPTGEKMAQIRRVFQSANIIQECVDNWKDGLIAEDFVWYFKDASGKRVKAAEAEIQVQRWMDWIEQQAIAADPATTQFKQSDPWSEFVLSLGVIGEGNLRLWQPRRYENDPDPIKRIHLHSPKAGSVEVTRDDDGFIDQVSYSYGKSQKEVQRLNESGELEIMVEGGDSDSEPLLIDTQSRWTVQQVRSPSLLNPSIKQLQNSINHSLSMKLRNQELAGFRERVFLNCQAPGEWIDDPNTPGAQKFVPGIPLERGPGIDSYHFGVPTGDVSNPGYASASIHESEPISIESFRQSVEIDILLLYRQFKQGHLLAVGEGANLSGESRIQQRQAFELFLRGWKRRVESAIANVLNVVLKILGYENLEAVVELRITTGKLSPEERQAVITEFDKGLLSKATTMARLGSVNDVDAELALIEEEESEAMRSRPQPALTPEDLQPTETTNGTEPNPNADPNAP